MALRKRAMPERPEPTEPLTVGELTVDFRRRRATLAGRPVGLTDPGVRGAGGPGGLRRRGGASRQFAGTQLGSGPFRGPAPAAHRGEEPAPQARTTSAANPVYIFTGLGMSYRMPKGETPAD